MSSSNDATVATNAPANPPSEAPQPPGADAEKGAVVRISKSAVDLINMVANGRTQRDVLEASVRAYANPSNMVNRGLSELTVAVKALELVNFKQCLLLAEVLKACTRVDEVSHLHHARVAALVVSNIKRLRATKTNE